MSENTLSVEEVVLPKKRHNEDTLEDRMSENAYNNILPARYQRRNEQGELIEEQEDVFRRVACNIALSELAYANETVEVSRSDYRESFRDRFPEDKTKVEVTEDNVRFLNYVGTLMKASDELRHKVKKQEENYHALMNRLAFMPNTPTLINAGDELQQLSACFVDSPSDDMDDIHDTAREAADIFQSGGGMGYAFWKLRPYGDAVGSTGGIASGPITFMRTFDQMCKTIAQGGTRRGAQMGVMRVSHPDIIEFVHSKNKDVSLAVALGLNDPKDPTNASFREALDEARELIEDGQVPKHLRNAVERHLSNFNISVGVSEEFMDAVEADEEYTLVNPRTEEPHIVTAETKEEWSRYDLGHHLEVGEEMQVPARDVWERIIEGAHENGEPGVIYLDEVNKDHSFDIEKYPDHEILATNPCGEQPLEEYEACNLGHINLSTIVSETAPDWRESDKEMSKFLDQAIDWAEFNFRIDQGTRFLDSVVTMSDFPIQEIEDTVTGMRKIGLGIMGYAQLLIQLGIPYGSDDGNDVATELMEHINHRSKETSRTLASERGAFEFYDESKYSEPTGYPEWFEKHVGKNPWSWEDGYELRNHNTTTIAPTGTTSMIGNTSGGCEPLFNVAYLKNVSQDIQGDDELVEFDDYFLRTLEANDIDVQAAKEEAADMLMGDGFDGPHALESVPDAISDLFVTSGQLSGIEHASVQCAFQRGVDSAISKTVNFPSSATIDDVREVYEYIYQNGGKGVTVYVDGSREKAVLSTSSNKADEDDADDEEPHSDADTPLTPTPRPRPEVLNSTVYPISTGYGELNVFVNQDNDGEPFEVFAEIGKSGGYTHSFTEAVGRLSSLALRCGIPPEEIIEQLDGIRSPKVGWDSSGKQIESIPDAISHALDMELGQVGTRKSDGNEDNTQEDDVVMHGGNPECPRCSELSLYMSEGCKTCESCGWSEC